LSGLKLKLLAPKIDESVLELVLLVVPETKKK
jgi:hypothetical protein